MTTLLYYLIRSLLALLAPAKKSKIEEMNLVIEKGSLLTKMTTLLYYLIHSLLPFLAGASKDKRE